MPRSHHAPDPAKMQSVARLWFFNKETKAMTRRNPKVDHHATLASRIKIWLNKAGDRCRIIDCAINCIDPGFGSSLLPHSLGQVPIRLVFIIWPIVTPGLAWLATWCWLLATRACVEHASASVQMQNLDADYVAISVNVKDDARLDLARSHNWRAFRADPYVKRVRFRVVACGEHAFIPSVTPVIDSVSRG